MTRMECPCRNCQDRNALCHTEKGNCPHGYKEWAKANAEERERVHDLKMSKLPPLTAAKERRHFNWIKYGEKNTRR